MSKALRIIFLVIAACVCQTNWVGYIRIAGVAPDMMIVFLVLLTSYCGQYSGFCSGAMLAMIYDASVGYILAINLVAYTFIGWFAPLFRKSLDQYLKKLKHKSILEMMLICFALTLMREILYIGYLFLIGAEQSLAATILRALLCAAYSAVMIVPCSFIVHRVMRPKIKKGDLQDDDLLNPSPAVGKMKLGFAKRTEKKTKDEKKQQSKKLKEGSELHGADPVYPPETKQTDPPPKPQMKEAKASNRRTDSMEDEHDAINTESENGKEQGENTQMTQSGLGRHRRVPSEMKQPR